MIYGQKMRMSPSIDQLIDKYGLPPGFKRIAWSAVSVGQTVWVYGTHLGDGKAYGPHTVDNITERRLQNCKGRNFLEYQESLLVLDQ